MTLELSQDSLFWAVLVIDGELGAGAGWEATVLEAPINDGRKELIEEELAGAAGCATVSEQDESITTGDEATCKN
jgi:hypothetical protein